MLGEPFRTIRAVRRAVEETHNRGYRPRIHAIDGLGTLEKGPGTLEEGFETLEKGPGTLEEGLGTLEKGLGTLKEGLGTLEESRGSWTSVKLGCDRQWTVKGVVTAPVKLFRCW